MSASCDSNGRIVEVNWGWFIVCWQNSVSLRVLEWKPMFLSGYCLEATLSSLTYGLLHMAACFNGVRSRESVTKRRISNKTEVIDFYSLHLEVISSHICHIQFVESKSLDPSSPHLKRGNWTWVWIIIETKNHCVIFEGCLTHFLSRYRKKSVGAFLLAWYNYWLKKQQQTNKQNPSLPLKWITFYFY